MHNFQETLPWYTRLNVKSVQVAHTEKEENKTKQEKKNNRIEQHKCTPAFIYDSHHSDQAKYNVYSDSSSEVFYCTTINLSQCSMPQVRT